MQTNTARQLVFDRPGRVGDESMKLGLYFPTLFRDVKTSESARQETPANAPFNPALYLATLVYPAGIIRYPAKGQFIGS